MNEVWIIVLWVILEIIIFFISIYYLVIFIHPDEGKFYQNFFYKLIIFISLLILQQPLILLCIDNSYFTYKLLDINLGWNIIIYIILIYNFVILPIIYYYSISFKNNNICYKLIDSFTNYLIFIIINSIIIASTYFFAGKIKFNFQLISNNNFNDILLDSNSSELLNNQINQNLLLVININLFIYLISYFLFLGIVLFVIYFSKSLFSFPYMWIHDFLKLPKYISFNTKELIKKKLESKIKIYIEKCHLLKKIYDNTLNNGTYIQRKKFDLKYKNQLNNFTKKFDKLEKNIINYKEIFLDKSNYSIILIYIRFIIGIILFILNTIVLVDIIIIVSNKGSYSILNNFLRILSQKVGIFFSGIFLYFLSILFMVYIYYGNYLIGSKIFFFFEFHPLKINNTWISSFMINLIFLALTIIPLIIFINDLLENYSINSNFYNNISSIHKEIYLNKFIYKNKVEMFLILICTMLFWLYDLFKKLILKLCRNLCCCCNWFKKKKTISEKIKKLEMVKLK